MKRTQRTGRTTTTRQEGRKVKTTRGGRAPQRLDDAELGAVAGGRDAASGQAVGRRIHKPIRFTAHVDTASSKLF